MCTTCSYVVPAASTRHKGELDSRINPGDTTQSRFLLVNRRLSMAELWAQYSAWAEVICIDSILHIGCVSASSPSVLLLHVHLYNHA